MTRCVWTEEEEKKTYEKNHVYFVTQKKYNFNGNAASVLVFGQLRL